MPARGPWSSPVVMVRKKDGSPLFCVDYRELNAVTRVDARPLCFYRRSPYKKVNVIRRYNFA
ncbi:Transposon Ty3-I Gag-Pol polyprotein [Trichinella patagoniensis]|uniref:Transposon Ty3-I Gag-Pol polyprotein n=1 Tax=Trichinella patagoniensis TaxID=990121 RepID=A0A0V0YS42_9BILA|nr:Transposon Ty3-I Gag-Pol polyprotein [Trichinella patagoniensis]